MVTQDGRDDSRIGPRLAILGAVASSGLAALNLVVGSATSSRAVFATGLEFAGDVLASLVVSAGLLAAARPPDDNHPYGHGRAETLAALVVGLILVCGGLVVCWDSLQEVEAQHPPPGRLAVTALLVAIIVRSVLAVFKLRVGRRIGSVSLVADGWNDSVDILAAVVALAAVVLVNTDSVRFAVADHYGGFAVGVVMLLTALRVVREASLALMDTMPRPEMISAIRQIAGEITEVAAVETVRARRTGLAYHVDLHIEVAPEMSVAAGHVVAGRVREHLRTSLPWVTDVLVHVEPAAGD